MKPVYGNLLLKAGAVTHGIVSIKAAPRDWLMGDPVIDFSSGQVLTAVSLLPGKNWVNLEFAKDTYKYDEKFKSNKSGNFYEISISGSLNDFNAELQQIVESIRYHEMIAIVMDRNKRLKLVGTKNSGLVVSPSNNLYSAHLELMMDSEAPAPFYRL